MYMGGECIKYTYMLDCVDMYIKCVCFKNLAFYVYGFFPVLSKKCGAVFLSPCDFDEVRISGPQFPFSYQERI